ncbi:hypothetical protein HPB52_013608 [Rhipicephalus sanguineus]|uniref:Uncharacterized protein n=1 Tax=Rhipicephalus sanguineus TaxID=34632 RepID=A0A9D4Q704_RHISA|nr:hypothetical protein HPB52_013608 [Rhipicephalus sanguineus]
MPVRHPHLSGGWQSETDGVCSHPAPLRVVSDGEGLTTGCKMLCAPARPTTRAVENEVVVPAAEKLEKDQSQHVV